MNRHSVNTFGPLVALILATSANAHEAPVHEHAELIPLPPYVQSDELAGGARSLAAAQALLDSLDEDSKSRVMFDLDAAERSGWSNLPAAYVDRAGLAVAELSDEQRALLFQFLSASLGEPGYRRVMDIMAAEAFLSNDGSAKRHQWDPQNYWISFYGTPDAEAPWGWQYGGHHLGLNISVEGNAVESMSPSFVGTEPAVFTLDGVAYEVVVDMHRAGYAVYAALDAQQQAQADAGKVPKDVLTGPGNDGVVPDTIGIAASAMTDAQRDLLLAAIREWVSIQPNENADLRMAEIEAELDQAYFAWIGTDAVNSACYMRIQGPDLIIELLSTGGNVGDSASGQGHYHTMYRRPSLEYGG